MKYIFRLTTKAQSDVDFFKKSGNLRILSKALSLIDSIVETPYQGIGKPEALKHELSGLWSRRISQEHRIIYQVLENEILIHSIKGHYI